MQNGTMGQGTMSGTGTMNGSGKMDSVCVLFLS